MKEHLKRIGEQGGEAPRKRWRFPLAVVLIAAVILGVIALDGKRRDARLPEFPILPIEGEPGFLERAAARNTAPSLSIRAVSADGLWVCFYPYGAGATGRWYFDVEQRRFVSRLPATIPPDSRTFYWPLGGERWVADSIVVMRSERVRSPFGNLLKRLGIRASSHDYPADVGYFEVNCRTHKMRRLALLKSDGRKAGISLGALSRDGSLFLYGAFTNSDQDEYEFRLRNLASGKERVIAATDLPRPPGTYHEVWDWLPDNRTVVIYTTDDVPFRDIDDYRIDSLFLVDALGERPPKHLRVLWQFDRARLRRLLENGILQSAADRPSMIALLGCFGKPSRARFAVRFQEKRSSTDRASDRSSIWDMDLESASLSKVMDLKGGIGRERAVLASPSGNAFLTEPTDALVLAITGEQASRPVLYRIGQQPRQIPVDVAWPSQHGLDFSVMRFLDEHTLIYVQPACEIWKFDLRTWQSELLWRPGTTDSSKRITDN